MQFLATCVRLTRELLKVRRQWVFMATKSYVVMCEGKFSGEVGGDFSPGNVIHHALSAQYHFRF